MKNAKQKLSQVIMSLALIPQLAIGSIVMSPLAVQAQGVGSGGGGNSIDRRMIESYRIRNASKLPGAKNLTETLNKLSATSPFFAKTLRETFYDLAWYVVPAPLASLPAYKNGLSFNSDQTAFQTRREVFIDSEKLPRNEVEQGTLLLHEILMAEILRTRGNANAAEHTRVRQMVVAIQENRSAEAMNAAILRYGFTGSATADIWMYQLILQKPKLTDYSPEGVILARKGSKFFVQLCSAESLAEIRESQRNYNQAVFPNFQRGRGTCLEIARVSYRKQ